MFRKLHGVGNDFIIGRYVEGVNYEDLSKKICDRHTGIGADGLLLMKMKGNLPYMVFYNSDGSLAPMCGNGIRCFSYYLILEKVVSGKNFDVDTLSGIMHVEVTNDNPFMCKVCLGKADFSSKKLDLDAKLDTFLDQKIKLSSGKEVEVSAIYMTTHHLVVIVDDLEEAINSGMAQEIQKNKVFTKGINVNLVQVIDRDNVTMKTYERGAGWTLACGTGASSAYVILKKKGLINNEITINLEKGKLKISSIDDDIYMEGPAVEVASEIVFNE